MSVNCKKNILCDKKLMACGTVTLKFYVTLFPISLSVAYSIVSIILLVAILDYNKSCAKREALWLATADMTVNYSDQKPCSGRPGPGTCCLHAAVRLRAALLH